MPLVRTCNLLGGKSEKSDERHDSSSSHCASRLPEQYEASEGRKYSYTFQEDGSPETSNKNIYDSLGEENLQP